MGEEIHIEGGCSGGSGKDYIRFSPVSKIVFTNKIDPKLYESALQKYIDSNPIYQRKMQKENL